MVPDYKRRPKYRFLALVTCVFIGTLDFAHAHHSFGEFDLKQQRTIRGTVVSFEWINPHVWTRIESAVRNEERTIWSFEGMSPDYLGRRGWNRSSLQAGDFVEIVYFPRHDNQPGGMLLSATLADGTVKVMTDSD